VRTPIIAFSLLLASCVPGGYWETTTTVAPPTPYVEYANPAPQSGYVWVDGYWWWDGSSYVWVQGHWGVPPTAGYVWVNGGWVDQGGSYVYVYGRWAAPGTRPAVVYVHPQRARVEVRPGTYRAEPRVQVRVAPAGRGRRSR